MAISYSLNSSTIKTTPVLEKIAVAAKAGYSGIELWHNDIDAYVADGGCVEDIRKCLDDHGVCVPTTIHIHNWFQPAGQEHVVAMEEARRKLDHAKIVGAPYTIAGPPREAADRKLGMKHYHDLLQLGVEFGVRPAFEYLGFVEDIKSIDDAIEIIEGCGHPHACLVLDPFHSYVGEGGIEAISRLRAEQVAVAHFNDAPAVPEAHTQRDPDRVMPGEGVIDLKRFCTLLSQIGYDGFLSLELFRPDLWEQNPLEVAQTGLEKMKAVVEG